jgi:lysophospholipase L1-like esterase
VGDGDSITAGAGVSTPYTALLTLNMPSSIDNTGVPGFSCVQSLADAPSRVDPFFVAGLDNVVEIWCGTNDIVNGATPAATYSTLSSYISARHAVGWKVIVATMLSRVGLDTQKDAYNALILANSGGADGIANFTGTLLGCDGCYADSTWFQADGIHPTQLGVNTYEAPINSAAANALP